MSMITGKMPIFSDKDIESSYKDQQVHKAISKLIKEAKVLNEEEIQNKNSDLKEKEIFNMKFLNK